MYNSRNPLVVVYAGSPSDVAASIAFAAARQLPLCTRAGGHDHVGASICDGGVVVDVSMMKQVRPT
jgi:FAD/FMN-containing dehydrogenase